ncbi:MAG: hypothetical protein AABM67_20165 [Acidobacteriota bacterium]
MELPPVLASAPGLHAAELVIDGLSVFCFNRINSENFWEVAYPRMAEHDLQITIQEFDAAGQPNGTAQVYDVDQGVKSFDISLTNGSVGHYTQFPLGGPSDPNFDRTDPAAPRDNPHDLGWMVDLAGQELQHGNAVLLPRHPSRPISLARIRHSLFCTLKPEDKEVRISPIIQSSPTSAASYSLPLNNTEIVGVLLGSGPGELRFESDPVGSLNINPLPYSQSQRYRIEIRNNDGLPPAVASPFVRGDLYRFYGVVIQVDGEQKDLWAHSNNEVTPDGDCHPDFYGGTTLEPLILP